MHHSIVVSPPCKCHMPCAVASCIVYVRSRPSHHMHHCINSWLVLRLVLVCQNHARFCPFRTVLGSAGVTCFFFPALTLSKNYWIITGWVNIADLFDLLILILYWSNSFSLPTSSTSICFPNFLPSSFTTCDSPTIRLSSTQLSHIANSPVLFLEKYIHGPAMLHSCSIFFIISNSHCWNNNAACFNPYIGLSSLSIAEPQ